MMDTPTSLSSSIASPQSLSFPSPPTLMNLPMEIQERSMRFLDRSSLLSLAQTHGILNRNSQPTLFRHINFLISPPVETKNQDKNNRKAKRYRRDLKRLVSTMLRRLEGKNDDVVEADPSNVTSESIKEETRAEKEAIKKLALDRCGWVQSVKMVSDPIVNEANITLLEKTSASLIKLEITPYYSIEHSNSITSSGTNLLEVKMLQSSPSFSFPKLTHVILGTNSIHYVEFFPLLLKIAPNLTRLYADLSNQYRPDTNLGFDLTIPDQTKIRNLRIRFVDALSFIYFKLGQSFNIVLDILSKSPNIATLSFDYITSRSDDLVYEGFEDLKNLTMGQIQQIPDLLELDWGVELFKEEGKRLQWPDFSSCEKVRKLSVKYHDWSYPVHVRVPDSLEELDLNCTDRQDGELYPPPITLLPQLHHALNPKFAFWLRKTPQLHTIRYFSKDNFKKTYSPNVFLDDYHGYYVDDGIDYNQGAGVIESSHGDEVEDQITARIFSIHHKDEVILHGRFLAHDVIIHHDAGRQTGSLLCCHGDHWIQRGEEHNVTERPPTWRDFGDWNGIVIPAQLLDRMRRSENLNIGEWEKRSVRVSEGTWEMVSQWKEGMMAAKKNYDAYLNGEE